MFISEAIHSALVILGELASTESCRRISPKQISEENNIPQEIIDKVVLRLTDMGYIRMKNEPEANSKYSADINLYLTKHPDELYITDIIKQFNKNSFSGSYINTNGEQLPQSQLTYCINRLRRRAERLLETRMQGMSLNVLVAWASIKNEEPAELSSKNCV